MRFESLLRLTFAASLLAPGCGRTSAPGSGGATTPAKVVDAPSAPSSPVLGQGKPQMAIAAIPGASLTDLWEHRAVFKLVRADATAQITDGNKVAFVTMPSGKWYAFAHPPGCGSACSLGVRSSDDKGAHWSAMTTIATPPAGTTSLVDQDAYYDPEVNRFYVLSQCQTAAAWRLCSFYRDGSDPMGPFTPVVDGPIVKSGYFFQDGGLCSAGNCPPTTAQEGTPDVLFKVGGLYYVSFHGYDGVHGYRGVAATTDFNTGWRVDAASGLFRDVMLGPKDCAAWQPGCIGIADTTTAVDQNYIYMIAEATDQNLLCKPGQRWTSALVRSHLALAATGGWESYDLNPLVDTGASAQPCQMNYQKLFQDQKDGFLYLTFYWFNGQTYELRYYRLEPGDARSGALVPPPATPAQPATTDAPPSADQVQQAAATTAASVPAAPSDLGHFQLAGILAKGHGGYDNCHQSLMAGPGQPVPGVAPIANVWTTACYGTFADAPGCACPAGSHWEPVGGHYADGCAALAGGLAAKGLANIGDQAWDCCLIEFKCMKP